jgi:hypothetical protein
LSGAPANTWLLALAYVCMLLNHLASPALGWIPPNQKLTGQTQDISMFLHFLMYEPVYYHSYLDTFPSASNEEQGWWVGVAMHVGDVLTYKVLTKQYKVIFRSAIRTAMSCKSRNHRVFTTEGEMSSNNTGEKMFIFSNLNLQMSDDGSCDRKTTMITIDPKELVGRTFLKETEED